MSVIFSVEIRGGNVAFDNSIFLFTLGVLRLKEITLKKIKDCHIFIFPLKHCVYQLAFLNFYQALINVFHLLYP